MKRGVQVPLRFRSQVFSTSQRFPSLPELSTLFRIETVPGLPPFRGFPSQESRTPLGATCSHAVVHRCSGTRSRGLVAASFADSHVARRSCLVPPTTMSSLSAHPGACFPVTLDPERRNRSVPPASPTSKPCSSCESVCADPSCPETAPDPLLGFRPL
jgi:hypothetical protein